MDAVQLSAASLYTFVTSQPQIKDLEGLHSSALEYNQTKFNTSYKIPLFSLELFTMPGAEMKTRENRVAQKSRIFLHFRNINGYE